MGTVGDTWNADGARARRRGYLTTQVAGGVWADKFGGKTVLGFGVIWWSIATVMTPLAASLGLPALLLARACMGVGEGVAMPAMNNLLSRCGVSKQTLRIPKAPSNAPRCCLRARAWASARASPCPP